MGQVKALDYGFADWLTFELQTRRIGVRTLARQIDENNIENVRRHLQKYLSGKTWPTDPWRATIAKALKVDVDVLPQREAE